MARSNYKVGDKVEFCLPDGSLLKGKIVEVITGINSNLVQYYNAYVLLAEGDIVKKT